MNLLRSHHEHGMRFHVIEVTEQEDDLLVGFAPGFYKVFTFDGERAVRLQDCIDRDDALRRLAG